MLEQATTETKEDSFAELVEELKQQLKDIPIIGFAQFLFLPLALMGIGPLFFALGPII